MTASLAVTTLERVLKALLSQPRVLEVRDILCTTAALYCGNATLLDVANLLSRQGHTAAGIVDEQGRLLGAITENDILCAYSAHIPAHTSVIAWLQSGLGRFHSVSTGVSTVQLGMSINEAAVHMHSMAAAGSVRHHLVVKDDDGMPCGILSALDLAQALYATNAAQVFAHRFGGAFVGQVMKPTSSLPACGSRCTLEQVLARMELIQQNMALIVDDVQGSFDTDMGTQGGIEDQHMSINDERFTVLGVVTPRDALRAFAEHVPLNVEVGYWLRMLRSNWEVRQVRADAHLAEVASMMSKAGVHHLVVLSPADANVVGVVSALDLAHAIAYI